MATRRPPTEAPTFADHFGAIARQRRAGHPGQARRHRARRCSACVAEGHLLIEDVPGVGKTSLAKALAASIDCTLAAASSSRPTCCPSDVVGRHRLEPRQRATFEFRPGPVFANIVLGDEINRASPKTQSALLEAMEERQVTVDGTTYPLEPARSW